MAKTIHRYTTQAAHHARSFARIAAVATNVTTTDNELLVHGVSMHPARLQRRPDARYDATAQQRARDRAVGAAV